MSPTRKLSSPADARSSNSKKASSSKKGARTSDPAPEQAPREERPARRRAKPAGAVAAAASARLAGDLEARPSGNPVAAAVGRSWAQEGERLTTAQGLRVDDTDNSLTAGPRGPSLLEDFHLREKIMHFDHERIPERVVHARGAGAHGTFEATDGLDDLCAASFLRAGTATPVFVRFSTVAGSRGSADTARDVRGFATKFYTEEGNFDLVGNNIPVFFIQDGIKFPDLIHAAKPEPDREIPQAQTAHDTFWDFVSLTPESTHMLLWTMSDRAIPRSFATMEGFGVHTFRLVADDGTTSLVKWHWKPVAGVHSLVWEEAQLLGGVDPDFHRRDLNERIASGNFPQWQLGVQVMPDTPEETFEGIDLLDPTKIVPEELCPVRIVGTMTLDRNPANYFAETEQVAFHPGHLVPGIDVVDDPLLQARLFSYLDTQLTRLGGPNFSQIPINRPVAPVNDDHRDGFGQQAVHEGIAPYVPNSLGAGCPFAAVGGGAFTSVPQRVDGVKVRQRPTSFDDHFSQATLFYRSLTTPEQDHVVGAFSFELAKCTAPEIRQRMVDNLSEVDADLAERVAAHLGTTAPAGTPIDPVQLSEALSMDDGEAAPVNGRTVALLVDDATSARTVSTWRKAADPLGVEVIVVGPRLGDVLSKVAIDRSLHITKAVEYDGVVLAADPDEALATFVDDAYRHHKTIGFAGRITPDVVGISPDSPGVATDPDAFFAALSRHRHWDRT